MGIVRGGNFASQPSRPVALVAAVTWAAAIVGCVALIWILAQASALHKEQDQLSVHRLRMTEEVAAFETLADAAPTGPDIAALAERVDFFNTLTGPRTLPLMDILRFLEQTMPLEVWVSQLAYDAETGRLSLALQAFDEADLPPALRLLENSVLFEDVILERQLRLQQGEQALVQYDVRAIAP